MEVTDPYKNPVLAPILESAKRLKERFSDVSMTTSVAGPISTAIAVRPIEVMKDGSIDDVIETCKDCLRKCGDNPKGYILNTGCQLPIGTPKRNVEAFIYAGKKIRSWCTVRKASERYSGRLKYVICANEATKMIF